MSTPSSLKVTEHYHQGAGLELGAAYYCSSLGVHCLWGETDEPNRSDLRDCRDAGLGAPQEQCLALDVLINWPGDLSVFWAARGLLTTC